MDVILERSDADFHQSICICIWPGWVAVRMLLVGAVDALVMCFEEATCMCIVDDKCIMLRFLLCTSSVRLRLCPIIVLSREIMDEMVC